MSVRRIPASRRRGSRAAAAGGLGLAVVLTGTVAANAAADTTPPGTPSGVKAVYYGRLGTVLNWGKVTASDLDHYAVYRATTSTVPTGKGAKPIGTAAASALSLTDATTATAAAGTGFYYAVTAVDHAGNESKPSGALGVKATDKTPPPAPGSLKFSPTTNGITVSWTEAATPDLAGFQVSSSTTASGTYSVLATVTSGSTYADTAAVAGRPTYYRVTAVDRAGNVSSPTSASATRPAPGGGTSAPTPTGLKAATSSAGVLLTWTANPAATTKGYLVSRAGSSTGPYTTLTSAPVTGTSYTDTTAPVGATSYYQLVAVSTSGAPSAPASVSFSVPKDTTAPATPSSAQGKANLAGGVTVTWSANKEADLAGYTVDKRDGSGNYVSFLPSAGGSPLTATTFTDSSVREGVTAYYRIRAVDRSGNISGYASVTAVNPMVAPAAPAGVKAVADATHGIDLTWTANKESDLAGYRISRSGTANGTYTLLTTLPVSTAGSAPAYNDTTAPKGVAQYYRVVALDTSGNVSATSSTVSATSTTDPVAATPVPGKVLNVSKDGANGAYTTVGAALATIPSTNLSPVTVRIAPGTYTESLEVSSPYVTLQGTTGNPADVVISDDKASGTADPAGGTYGTAGSATMYVSAANVTLQDLTVQNAFNEQAHPEITSQQAVALRVEGDRFVANHVRLLGNQDTLLADTPKPTTRVRQYYVNSYIEGDVDYLFGAADAVFDRVTLHSLDRGKSDNGAVTAASTDKGSKYGFLIYNSRVVSEGATGTVHLGRPWHPSADPNAIGSVVYVNTQLPAAIASAQPWEDMSSTDATGTKVNFTWQSARFDESGDYGPGAGVNANRPQLAASAVQNDTPAKYLAGSDGWNPVLPGSVAAAPSAPTGLAASADSHTANLTWTAGPEVDVTGYNVYRSDPQNPTLTKVASVAGTSYGDGSLTNGTSYSYVVTAVNRAGQESAQSAPVSVTVAPAPLTADITVAKDGSGQYTSVQAALNAAPAGTAANPTIISIRPGTYVEQLTVSKPWTYLVGSTGNPRDVVLEFDVAHGTINPTTGLPYGTGGSAAVTNSASNTLFKDLTVQNEWDPSAHPSITDTQAVALKTTGDKQTYEDVRVLGRQDTLLTDSPSVSTYPRVYFHNAFVEGTVDFIFGRATAVFDRSTIHGLNRAGGTVVSPSTSAANPHGLLFIDSRFTADSPAGTFELGRPWMGWPDSTDPNNTSRGETAIVHSWLGDGFDANHPWIDFQGGLTWNQGRFGEYQNTGPSAAVNANRPQLSAAPTAGSWLAGSDGWNPVVDPAPAGAPVAPQHLAAAPGNGSATLTWDENTDPTVVGYHVYRTTGSGPVPTDAAHRVDTTTLDRAGYTDTDLTNGAAYSYVVTSITADGTESAASAVQTVTPAKPVLKPTVIVAADGSGDYTDLAAALAAITPGAASTVIGIKPGTYTGSYTVTPANVVLMGTTGSPADVVLTSNGANPTLTVTGNGFQAQDISVRNTGSGAGVHVSGDQELFEHDVIAAPTRAVWADTPTYTASARQMYDNTEIDGTSDLVLGPATAVINNGTINVTGSGGAILTPSNASAFKGLLLINSTVNTPSGVSNVALGRPYLQGGTNVPQAVVRESVLGAGIAAAQPWAAGPNNAAWTTGNLHEYGNTGPGATVNDNRPQLTPAQSTTNTVRDWLGTPGWYPSVPAPVTPADVTPPTAPAVTTATDSGTVTLTWATDADVASYSVYRAAGSTVTPVRTSLVRSGVTGTSFTDTGLTNKTAYSYLVVGYDAAGNTAASAVVTATPADSTAPAAPTGLKALGGDGTVALSWTANTEPDVAGYTVYAVAADGTRAQVGAGTGPSYTDTAVTNGTAYTFVVSAVDTAGNESPVSAPVTVTPDVVRDTTPPAAPTGLTAAVAAGSKVQLAWTAPADTDVVGYQVFRSSTGTVSTTGTPVNGTSLVSGTSYTDTTATAGTTYQYAVIAVDAAKNASPASSAASVKALHVDAVVAASGGDYTSVQSALAAAPATGSYVVGIAAGTWTGPFTVSTPNVTLLGMTGTPADVVLTNATATATLTVSANNVTVQDLRVENTIGARTTGPAVYATGDKVLFEHDVLSAHVRTIFADTPTYTATASQMYDNSEIDGDSDIVLGRATAVFNNDTVNIGAASGAILTPSTAANAKGFLLINSTVNTPAGVTSVALGRPYRAWGDTYTPNSRGQAIVRETQLGAGIAAAQPWTSGPAGEAWTLGRFDEYGNTGPGATVNANRPQLTGAQSTTATVTDFIGAPTWYPAVQAPPAPPADTTAPAAPSGLAAGAGDGKALLSWTASSENDLAGYNLYRSDSGAATTASTKVNTGGLLTGTSLTDTGLTDGTSDSYVLTAVDQAGNESAVSTVATVTPTAGDATAPAVPAGVTARLGKATVTVGWTADTDADLAGYTVYRATGGGAPVKVSGATPVAGTSFTDTTAAVGTAYTYTVTATDTSANESAASAAVTATPVKADLVVASDGSGDATTVQAGINLLADNADYTAQGGRVILVQPGTYTGVITSGNRYGVTLVGASANAADTVITAGGTGAVATATLSGNGWTLRNLTVANTNGATTAGAQATALQVKSGDKDVFDNVRFLGDKQTLLLSTAGATTFTRSYFRGAYIEGGADLVLGRATAVFDRSTFHVLNRPGATLTDSSVDASYGYGFLITNSTILTDGNPGSIFLGRPYSTQGKAQVVVRNTVLGAAINNPKPWKDWDTVTLWTAGRFFEYQNTGAGAAITDPTTRPQLSDADAANYTAQKYLAGSDGWNPVG